MRSWKDKISPDSDMQHVSEDTLVSEMTHGYAVVEEDIEGGIDLSFYSKNGKWITDLAYFSREHALGVDPDHDDYLLRTYQFNDCGNHWEEAMRFNGVDIANVLWDWGGMTLSDAVRAAGKDWTPDAVKGLADKLGCHRSFASIMEALADKLESR